MDVYKLRVTDVGSKPIDKDEFERETCRREPWYQLKGDAKDAYFAVCPACDNPVQLIGLYKLPPNHTKPHGRHLRQGVPGLAPNDPEARENCPYFSPRQHEPTARKARFDGVPRKIVELLIEQFDRVVYVLEKQTGLSFSKAMLEKMLARYKGGRGFLYTGAALRNVPWIFAYMSDATDLFGQRVTGNDALQEALKLVSGAEISPEGRLVPLVSAAGKKQFFDVKVSFIHHRMKKEGEEGGLVESMKMVVSDLQGRQLREIHSQVIEFDHDFFERLIQLPEGKGTRRLDRVELARNALADLLA
jgi:hypothetical protein